MEIIKTPITLHLSEDAHRELLQRLEESKTELGMDIMMDSFCSWAVRYYLQHAYKEVKHDSEEEQTQCKTQ